MNTLDTIENEISNSLQVVANLSLDSKNQGKKWPDGKWTKKIKDSLVKLGHNYNYGVSAAGCKDANWGEWLFDLAWYKYNSENKLENLILAMESEWGNKNAIRSDFEKLIVSRSQYCLMIFQGKSIDVVEITVNLKDRIDTFQRNQKGDRYLFAGWDWDAQKFIFSHHIV